MWDESERRQLLLQVGDTEENRIALSEAEMDIIFYTFGRAEKVKDEETKSKIRSCALALVRCPKVEISTLYDKDQQLESETVMSWSKKYRVPTVGDIERLAQSQVDARYQVIKRYLGLTGLMSRVVRRCGRY
ncbi:MAG: hypothetical protein Q4Q17_01145 [Tissierellia bacterium]|nr:hypothetical protein [Tissierellia bacterium]